MCIRYIDDVCVIWSHGHDKLKNLKNIIKFTIETETEGQLSVLDVLVKESVDDQMFYSVYRKLILICIRL